MELIPFPYMQTFEVLLTIVLAVNASKDDDAAGWATFNVRYVHSLNISTPSSKFNVFLLVRGLNTTGVAVRCSSIIMDGIFFIIIIKIFSI